VQCACAGATDSIEVGQYVGTPGLVRGADPQPRVPGTMPRALAVASAAQVCCEMSLAFSSVAAAICVRNDLPTEPVPSTTCRRKRAFLASR